MPEVFRQQPQPHTGNRRRLLVLLVATATVATTAVAATATPFHVTRECAADQHVADGSRCDWTGHAPPIVGVGYYNRGEFIYNDFVHDDSGANVDGLNSNDVDPGNPVTGLEYPNPQDPTSPRNGATDNNNYGRMRHSGDYGYPMTSPSAPFDYVDPADLEQFRVAVDHGQLHYLAQLGALVHPDDAIVSIGIDADHDSATGTGNWPHGAHLTEALGLDYVISFWGTGGDIIDYTHRLPVTRPIHSAANVKRNFLEADVPIPTGAQLGRWRYYVGSGRYDAASRGFAMPSPSAPQGFPPGALGHFPYFYDLLFIGWTANDEWRDTTQANDLAAADIAEDHADIDMAALAHGASRQGGRPTGLVSYNYRTLPLGPGEGEQRNSGGLGSINYVYLEPTQPGAMMLPTDTWSKPHRRRFMYFFHCLNCDQNIWENGVEDAATPGRQHIHDGALGTSHIQNIVNRNDLIVGGSLQRGEGGADTYGWFAEERDLLDNWHAMTAGVGVRFDPDRVMFSGMSMGGSTTEHMMTLYPDRLSAAIAYSAAAGNIDRLVNMRNVPFYQLNGDTGLDGTSPVSGRQTAQQLDALGYQHMYVEYLGRAHDFNLVYDSLPLVEPTAWRTVRDPNPARVTYELDAVSEDPKLGLVHDHAYWVRGLRLAEGATSGTVDVVALPLASKLPRTQSVLTGTFTNATTGNNVYVDWLVNDQRLTAGSLAQLQPGWTADPDVSVTTTRLAAPRGAGSNGFTASFTGLSAATLDLTRMGLRASGVATARLTTAAEIRLTLRGAGAGAVLLDGHEATVQRRGSALVVVVPKGSHRLRIG
ncbi:MAG TPA: hypothetical protein VFT62_06020 [Mycobacteriales bacterium]|nr:hypothetical protein [Mycobacteriales bacterium]